ncbi:plasmid mobilization relaxosome protein MobC [Variovorax sp. J22P271]|uniref:plasmid mobilization protein n=1 Tax=Variovorax davisae TaxID=3053515 RepID=UPI002576C26B|nr:plasmid mobilization relaxosome protein MobC [Variovorax sp. J22P271]MDM0036736.1 plasmid mobilization relaxosome protein MobC [Variovorax sp. J22P271]
MTEEHAPGSSADQALVDSLPVSHAKSQGEATKTRVVSFRISALAHAQITFKAEEAGISTRAWLEQAILGNRTQIVARMTPHHELKPLLFQACKAGNNLNQLAHRVNTLRLEGKLTAQECAALLKELQAIQATFREAVANARAD